MGKPKLRSSIKALHQSLFNFRTPLCKTMTWVCTQQAKTDSFRDAYNSFHTMYYSASSSISSDFHSINEESEQLTETHIPSIELSTTSSSSSTESNDSPLTELAVKGFISSKRFFFSPCTTKSIMEDSDPSLELKTEMGIKEIGFSESHQWLETEDEAGEGEQSMIMEKVFCKESVTMEMASMNPYMDFRISMEEMVLAHGLRDWSCLQELLQCYLRLNDKTIHKIIILAFGDLIINLITEEDSNSSRSNENNNNNKSKNKEICFPFPLCLQS